MIYLVKQHAESATRVAKIVKEEAKITNARNATIIEL